MALSSRVASLLIVLTSSLILMGAVLFIAKNPTTARDMLQAELTCAAALEQFYVIASEACIGKPDGYICNGGMAPAAEPAGPVSNSLAAQGALVDISVVDALRTSAFHADGTGGGLVWLRAPESGMRATLIGDVSMRDVSPPDFPAWTAFTVATNQESPACSAAPRSALVVQSRAINQELNVVINGVSIYLRGTVMIETEGSDTIFITLDGELRIIALGQTQGMVAGQEARVPYDPGDFTRPVNIPGVPGPFDPIRVVNFPLSLLDRPTLMPQPGFVSTEGAVNMRMSPSTDGILMGQVPPGQIMTILGRNPAGDWYHVRLTTGFTGWMFADLLSHNHGEINAVYSETPVPPQRFGRVGTTGRIISPNGSTMRAAPDLSFAAIYNVPAAEEVTLLARSPYSPWVKVDAAGVIGWVALLTMETQAIIESLPIDYDVPPPPQPTVVPGTWGNAFPDPNCYPNCGR